MLLAALALGLATGDATVYYGAIEGAQKPAVIVAQQVFDRIPEYQEIKRRGLGPSDSDYWVLLAKANEKFYAAVRRAAEAKAYDVILEKGTQAFDKEPPDATQAVIDSLEK